MAEFQEVIKERKRMCSCFDSCVHCPLWEAHRGEGVCRNWTFNNPAKAEKIIMRWSAEHPIMTNGKKFEEVFGFTPATMFEINCRNADWLDEEYQETK